MHGCSFQDNCRFYRKHRSAGGGTRLTRQLYDHYCTSGHNDRCAILLHYERTGGPPPKTLLPDGGRFIDSAEIYVLGTVALIFSLFALMLVTFCSFK